MIAIPIILVLVVVAVILAVYFHNRQKKIDSMEQSFYDTIEYIQRITTSGPRRSAKRRWISRRA